MFFREVAHEKLLDLQSARIPPCQTNQECIRPGSACEAGCFRVEEKPFFRILQCGAGLAGEGFVTCA